MIVPMKKVSLIVLGDKKTAALKKLRKLGILHIEISEGSGERLEQLASDIALLENAVFTVGKSKGESMEPLSVDEALEIARQVQELSEEQKACVARKVTLIAELERLKEWGDVDPVHLETLKHSGVDVTLYEIPTSVYNRLETVQTVCLQKTKSSVKCLAVVEDSEEMASLSQYRLELPTQSTDDMKQELENLTARVQSIEETMNGFARYGDSLQNAVKSLQKETEFEVYATGMAEECLEAEAGKQVTVSYFKGYIEAEKLDNLKREAGKNGWGLIAEDPTEEDAVPTKLKNNKFVSLIYPLTDFLGTVPGYFEYDISGWFLSFILIFFGIIFGDGGYGLLISAVAAALILTSIFKKKPVAPAFLLVGLFGVSTILWGTLTCTWFGLSADQLPVWLQNLSVPVISNVYADKLWHPFWVQGDVGLTTAQNLQIFCFSLALVQLTVAHVKGAIRNRKSLKMLGDIGSILQLIGIYYIVLSLVVNPQVFSFGLVIAGIPVGTVAIALIGVGFVLSFVFANYEGNLLKSILASLTNIVSVLLGVVNVFSDIVSYIRLWAVGLAGAAISATVNELAGPLLGNFLFMIVAIVLLVFGHGLNMILNVLSVIVHGIRLNTLEFSSHLDMSWSGHKFKPFEE